MLTLWRARTVGGMSDDPSQTPDSGDDNPFKGTPFEQFFSGAGAAGLAGMFGGSGAGGMDLSALFGQIQALMQPYDGPLNWDVALDVARKAVAQHPDPSVSQREGDAIADALRLADHWLDEATSLPLRGHLDRGVEPGRMAGRHARRVEGAGRADRPTVRGGDERDAPRGGPRGRCADPRNHRQGRRRDARDTGRVGSGRAGRRRPQRVRYRLASRPSRACRPPACQRHRVRRRAGRHRGRSAALSRAARGRPPTALHARAMAARPPDGRRHRLRPRHRDQCRRHPESPRGADARHRPD